MKLRATVGVAISALVVVGLLHVVDLRSVGRILAGTRLGWVAVGVLVSPLVLYARAVRWRYLFPPGRAPHGIVSATMIGYMVNNLMPLRAGDLVRVYLVGRQRPGGFWTALCTVGVERVLDGTTVLLLLGGLAFAMPVPGYIAWAAALLLAADVVAIALLVALATAPGLARAVIAWTFARWPGPRERAVAVAQQFVTGLAGIRSPSHVVPLLAATAASWILPAFVVSATLRAVNVSVPAAAPWAVLAFLGLGVSVPSAPGFVGVFHAAAALAVGMFGVLPSDAFAFALILHAVQFVPVTLVGWAFLLSENGTMRGLASAGVAAARTIEAGPPAVRAERARAPWPATPP